MNLRPLRKFNTLRPFSVFCSAKAPRRGVLTFEWMLLFTLLVIGVIGGIGTMRDTITARFISAGGALGGLDMSYSVPATADSYTLTHATVSACKQEYEDSPIVVSIADTK